MTPSALIDVGHGVRVTDDQDVPGRGLHFVDQSGCVHRVDYNRSDTRGLGERLRGVAGAFVFGSENRGDLCVLQQRRQRMRARLASVRQLRIRPRHFCGRHARIGTLGMADQEHNARSAGV